MTTLLCPERALTRAVVVMFLDLVDPIICRSTGRNSPSDFFLVSGLIKRRKASFTKCRKAASGMTTNVHITLNRYVAG